MKSPEEVLNKCLTPTVFGTWAGFLLYLLASHRYLSFLRPEFGLLLALALFIALGFMLAAMLRPKTERMDMSAVFRALVLLIPVLYYAAISNAGLGNQAFTKRFTGTMNGNLERLDQAMRSRDDEDLDAIFARGPLLEVFPEAPKEQTILDVFRRPELFKGKRVVLTGMIMRDKKLKPHFGGRDIALYRFLITCCAADALPLVVGLDTDDAPDFAHDQWVQVEGFFDIRQSNGKPVPLILKPLIKTVDAPAFPYLF